jgi:hypothetical protein
MTLTDMHIWFRQYAQQMGMQNVRAILPEQIDLLINTSIDDTVNQIIRENIGVSNDKIISDNSKISQINALSTLYTVVEVDCFVNAKVIEDTTDFAEINYSIGDSFYIQSINKTIKITEQIDSITLDENLTEGNEEGYKVINNVFEFDKKNAYIGKITAKNPIDNYLYLVDFSINYCNDDNQTGLNGNPIDNRIDPDKISFITNYYPVRLIEDSYLADSLNDFILKPRFRSPILTIYKQDTNSIFDLYIDKFDKQNDNSYYLPNKLIPNKFRIAYIAKPVHVRYSEDTNNPNIECNLPDYLHVDILKHAVDLYRLAVGGQPKQQQTPSNQ